MFICHFYFCIILFFCTDTEKIWHVQLQQCFFSVLSGTSVSGNVISHSKIMNTCTHIFIYFLWDYLLHFSLWSLSKIFLWKNDVGISFICSNWLAVILYTVRKRKCRFSLLKWNATFLFAKSPYAFASIRVSLFWSFDLPTFHTPREQKLWNVKDIHGINKVEFI